jgi:nitrite reductase/ring-hydroxylating ferredoxin subunit
MSSWSGPEESELFKEVADIKDIQPGGMRSYGVDGKEIVLCNDGGKFYAFDRKCGHMGAPLDMGTANGHIVTCPLHAVQFDVATGTALSGPLIRYAGEPEPPGDNTSRWIMKMVAAARTEDIRTYVVKIEGSRISVDL